MSLASNDLERTVLQSTITFLRGPSTTPQATPFELPRNAMHWGKRIDVGRADVGQVPHIVIACCNIPGEDTCSAAAVRPFQTSGFRFRAAAVYNNAGFRNDRKLASLTGQHRLQNCILQEEGRYTTS